MLESEIHSLFSTIMIVTVFTFPLLNAFYAQKRKHRTGVLWFFIALISGAGLANEFEVYMLGTGSKETASMLGFIVINAFINLIVFIAIFSLPKKTKDV